MPQASHPVITLLTDFGTVDPYVGICKGVALARCPTARIVDLVHDLEPGDVRTAGHLLAAAWRYFPEGTVHAAVVDPGVGTGRRILAAEFDGPTGTQRMVAPDNGLLSAVFDDTEPTRVVSVENEAHFLQPISATFHGRDVFAPIAAALADGIDPGDLGPDTDSWIHLPRRQPIVDPDGSIVGEVVYIDRFGNLVTSLTTEHANDSCTFTIGQRTVSGIQRTYGSVDSGSLVALIGSTGRVEISVNGGSAAGMLGMQIGAPVTLHNPQDGQRSDS